MANLLHYRVVSSPAAPPERSGQGARPTVLVLHGALGAGQNFRRFVQQLSLLRTDLRFVLVDLRCHGESSGMAPPHTLAACAQDLVALGLELGAEPHAIIGHSFGGKVALQYAHQVEGQLAAALRQVWVLDSVPGQQANAQDSEVSHVIAAVRAVPMPADSRSAVLRHLVEDSNLSSGLAQWMGTNLRRDGAVYRWRFDLDGIEELMGDYFRADLWPFLQRGRSGLSIELVIAERSSRWTPSLREQARLLPPQAQVRVHDLPNTGHWVHVDNPEGLLQLLAEFLSP